MRAPPPCAGGRWMPPTRRETTIEEVKQMTAERILTNKGTGVATIAPDATLGEAAAMLVENNIGAVVVSRDGSQVEGILSERDLVRAMREKGADMFEVTVGELMTREVATCARGDATRGLLALMTERRIRHVPVVDAGRLVGIVSIGDVVKLRLDDLVSETEAMRDYISH